jgi:hypothetical protein
MPLFICDRCGGRDNTATGFYWMRNKTRQYFGDDFRDGEALCAKCTPAFSEETRLKHEKENLPLPKNSILLGEWERNEDGLPMCLWHDRFEFKIPDAEQVRYMIVGGHMEYTDKLVELLGSKEAVEAAFKECEDRQQREREERLAKEAQEAGKRVLLGGGGSSSDLTQAIQKGRRHGLNSKFGNTIGHQKPKKHKRGPGKRGRP